MSLWTPDGRLDVVVLGPMRGPRRTKPERSNCERIKAVVETLLDEPELKALLRQSGFRSWRVQCPEGWEGAHIPSNVFLAIDKSDFVIFDMSSRGDGQAASPNVMYELGLVHSLGLPHVMIRKEGGETPFYLKNYGYIELAERGYPGKTELVRKLRPKLMAAISADGNADYRANPISRHYDNAAVVDISATMGLATGYYFNFLNRMLGDPNYLKHHMPTEVDRQITLVPNSLRSDAHKDIEDFKALVQKAGLQVQECKLTLPAGWRDDIRPIVAKRIGRICFDIPTTAYALRQSPRYLTLTVAATRQQGQAKADLARMEKRLLHQFGTATEYLLQRAHELQNTDISRHTLARIPTRVSEVHRLFGKPA